MFVEEGFRMRFANGEVIDFYADTTAEKDAWMNVLSECVGKDVTGSKGWTTMVLEKERKEKTAQLAHTKPLKESTKQRPLSSRHLYAPPPMIRISLDAVLALYSLPVVWYITFCPLNRAV